MRHPRLRGAALLRFLLAFAALFSAWGLLQAAVFAPSSLARADETEPLTPEEEERLEAIDRHTERGWKAFRSGNHAEALARMNQLERYDPENPLPDYFRARIHARTGNYEDAITFARRGTENHPEHRPLEGAYLDLLLELSRLDDLEAAARAALEARPDDLVARTALGLGLEAKGEREAALVEFDAVVEAYNLAEPLPEELPWVARAAIRATRLSTNPADDLIGDALKLLSRYFQKHEDDQDIRLEIADLYQEDRGPRGQSLANKHYRLALKENSEL
ncbi:MAG: tetratricopeptide repeat protein, partial [Planctomycetota bacterium]